MTTIVVALVINGLPPELQRVLPGPLASLGPITAQAATLAPTVGGTGAGINLRRNAAPHFFTMSDGARVAIYHNGSNNGYRILPAGSSVWGSFVQLLGNSTAVEGSAFTQVGNTIYGAISPSLGGGKVSVNKLVYTGGSIGQSSVLVAHGDFSTYNFIDSVYWDATNSYLHVLYALRTSGGGPLVNLWLEAYSGALSNVYSLDVLAYSTGNNASTEQRATLAGSGSSSFILSDWTALGVGAGAAITANASSYSVIADSAPPAFPVGGGAATDVVAAWEGSGYVIVGTGGTPSASSLQVLTRSATGVYGGWQLLVSAPTGRQIQGGVASFAPVIVRRSGSPTGDLAVLYHVLTNPGGSPLYHQIWSIERRAGSWGAGTLMAAGQFASATGASSDVNDAGNIPFLYGTMINGQPTLVATSVPFGDAGSSLPEAFGKRQLSPFSKDPVNTATGSFTTDATDLAMPGRVLPFAFVRAYNSADTRLSPLGPSWTHSYFWTLLDGGASVEIRRADGRRDDFTQNVDGSYAAPPNVFDTLVKNGDSSFTLTLVNQTKYQFSSAGSLTAIQEPAGNQLTLTYTAGNLTTITDAVGRAIALSYDSLNRLTQLQDPLGRKVTYGYDTNNRLITVTDKIGNAPGQNPLLHRWQYGYDGASRHLTTITDPDGRVRVTNSYDAQGRVFEQRDGLSKLTTFDYSTPGQTVITDPRGHATTFTFDSRARTLTQTDVVGANTYVISYTYDPTSGVRLSVTDRNAKTTDFTYDARGNVETKTDPQVDPLIPRYVTQYDHDTKNNLTVVTDPRTFTTTNTYHPTTNVLLSVTAAIDGSTSAVTTYEYTDATNPGMPTKIIAPRGNLTGTPDDAYATTLAYDTQGNLVTRIDPDGAKTTYGYDAVGRMTSFVDPDGYAAGAAAADHTWTIGYDENDQEKSRTDPLGKSLLYGYDGAGNRTSSTDRNGNVTTYTFDANARLATVLQKPDPVGNPTLVYTTTVGRDDSGNATRTTQANGVITDYGFDALDRMTSMTTHPAVGTDLVTSYVLDGNGNVLTKTTADGTVVTNTYDAMNRLKSIAATGLATITYDYDPSSNRVQMVDGMGTTTYQYDGLGRLTQDVQPTGTLGYAYDRDGNRTTLTYPGATGSVTYFYTNGGRLDHLTDWASRTSMYAYTPAGLVATLQYPNGMKAVYTYDRAQRLTAVADAVGSATVNREVYTLDAEGNRTANDEYVQGISTAPSMTWAASAQVNSNTGTSAQDHPQVAIAPDGSTYLVWDDLRDGNANIYLDRRDPATGNWNATDVRVNSDTGTRVQLNPAIAVDSASSAYIVWQDERNGAGKPDIFYRKRTAAGTWVASDVKISDESGGGGGSIQRNPRIAGKADGDMTAVWVDFRSSQKNVWASTLTNGTGSWAANKRVTLDNGTSDKDFPDVAVGADGTSYAVWQDNRNGNLDIYFASLAPGGATWSATSQKVSDDPGSAAQRLPRVGVDAEGNVTVVWLDERVTPNTIRMSRRLAGTSTWTASVVATDIASRPVSVALAVRADGTAQLAFGDTRGTSADIYRSEYDPWLRAWSTTTTLASDDPGSSAQQAPSIAYSAGEVVAAWRDDRAGNADVRARRATLAGGPDHFAYTYDGLNRLTASTGPVAESLTLGAASNISSRTNPTASFSYDGSNRVTGDGTRIFTWNGADRLTNRGTDTFVPDALARLVASTMSGVNRTFAYSGDGLLRSVTQATTTTYQWDSSVGVPSLVRAGTDHVVIGLRPLYGVRADGSIYTLASDGLGSVRAEVDATGAVTKSFRYRTYGEVASTSGGNPTLLGFASELADVNGLIYLRARWYDPQASVFLNRDPIFGDAQRPVSLNGFAYAHANPISLTDPSGLEPSAMNISAPDYVRASVILDPWHVGWGAQWSLAMDRYGNVYSQLVGLSASTPEAPRFSAAPFGITATAGWIIAAGVPSESATRAFLTGPSVSACAAYVTAVCMTLSPAGQGDSVFAVEGGLGTPDASFSGGYSNVVGKVRVRW